MSRKYAPRNTGGSKTVQVTLPQDVAEELERQASADEQDTTVAALIVTPLIPYVRAQAQARRQSA